MNELYLYYSNLFQFHFVKQILYILFRTLTNCIVKNIQFILVSTISDENQKFEHKRFIYLKKLIKENVYFFFTWNLFN